MYYYISGNNTILFLQFMSWFSESGMVLFKNGFLKQSAATENETQHIREYHNDWCLEWVWHESLEARFALVAFLRKLSIGFEETFWGDKEGKSIILFLSQSSSTLRNS